MPVLCFGPVCIPLNLLLPFLLGIAHRYGWLKWIRREWLTLTHWRQQFSRNHKTHAAAGATQPASAAHRDSSSADSRQQAEGGKMQYVCDGDICRLVPVQGSDSQQQQQGHHQPSESSLTSTAAAAPNGTTARQRKGAANIVGLKATDL